MLRNLTTLAAVLIFLLVGLLVKDHLSLPSKTLTIFYSSNMRGQLAPFTGDVGEQQNVRAGGIAFIRGLITETLKKYRLNPENTLLLDTGDALFGSAEASLTLGEAPFRLMVKAGYDAMAVGNMEFECGIETLRKFAAQDKLALLACNYRDLKSPLGNTFLPGKIIEKGGNKIGIIGLGHGDLARNTRQENLTQIEITDLQAAVQKTSSILKAQGADLLILLSHHPGLDERQDLPELFPDVDVVIGDLISAAHTAAFARPLICPTAFARGASLGLVRIPFIGGKWALNRSLRTSLIVDSDAITPDAELMNEVNKVESTVDSLLEKVIAVSQGDFKKAYSDESSIGDLITDTMRDAAKTQVAFQNSGGIKISFANGPIALRDLYEMLPFENAIVRMDLYGWQIENLVENSLSGKGSFLQASGIHCTYSSESPVGFRVIQLGINEEPIEWNRQYSVAVNDFMMENRLNWPELSQGNNIKVIGQMRENLKTYLERVGSITPNLDRRFIDIRDMDQILRMQALTVDLASLSQPVSHQPSMESEYGRLLADIIRRETDAEFSFIQRTFIKNEAPPLTLVSAQRVAEDFRETTGVQTLQIPGSVVQKIVEAGIASGSLFCFSGFSIELKEGKLVRAFPWEGDFDQTRLYKVALPQNFPSGMAPYYDIKDKKRTMVFSDIRRVFLNGIRRLGGKTELPRAVY